MCVCVCVCVCVLHLKNISWMYEILIYYPEPHFPFPKRKDSFVASTTEA